ARRAVAPSAGAPPVAPAAAKPSVAPSSAVAAPSVAPPVVVAAPVEKSPAATASASKSEAAASHSKGADGELERLRAEIKDTKAGAERTRLQRALVERLVELKREPEALDALRLMIHEDRYDPPFFFNTGNALARLGDASAAEDAYRKAILQRRGNYSRALNNLGVILIRQGHWDEAQETFAAALLQENHAYPEASYNLGRLYLLRGEADLAIREWTRTLRLEPAHAEAAAALARAYAEDGDTKRGLAVLDNFVARSTRGGTSGVPREISEARRDLVAAAAAHANEDDATNAKTETSEGAGGNRAGRASSNANFRALEVDRASYDLLRAARTQRERGSYEESVKVYRDVLARHPAGYFPPANLELGAALINLRRDTEAITALVPLTQKGGARFPVAYYHLGRLYERQGELARAVQHFARAAELYGDANPQVLIDLSRTREKTNDPAGALAAMDAYAASIARQGTVPAWVAERQAKLKQKLSTTQATQTSTAKP
ncbi:MAG TPA: tetratricopeptide repeat protein, partial [Pyrinomonadaceae bacterium]